MPSPSASAAFVAVAAGVGLLLVAAVGVDEVVPDPEVEAALPEVETAVGDVLEVEEQAVATATSRAAMAMRFMVRVWSTLLIRWRQGSS